MKDRFFLQKRSKRPIKDEEIESAESDQELSDYESSSTASSQPSDSEDNETSCQKRLRMAKEYLGSLQEKSDDLSQGAEGADHELVAARLKSDRLEQEGKLFRDLVSRIIPITLSEVVVLRGHSKCVTAVTFTSNGKYLYSAGKDGSIIKWDTKSLAKVHTFARAKGINRSLRLDAYGHSDVVYSLAVSSDSKFLASGGKDRMVNIYSVDSNKLIRSFFQHKDSITGLVFRRGQNELFSSSLDRSVKMWNIDSMSYVETLFGHQEGILDLDASVRERCISVGGRDRSLHLFKVLEESQLVFRADDGKYGSLNCCKMIDEEHFVCSTECGALLIFSAAKRKPIFQLPSAHPDASTVCCIGKVAFSNILITGSVSGNIRIWRISDKKDALELHSEFQVNGFPNSISTTYDGSWLAIGCGKEPRLGRWDKRSDFINGTFLVRLTAQE